MKWVGVVLAALGILVLLLTMTYQSTVESQTTVVQRVRGEELIGKPTKALLTSETKIVKGTGPENSKFIEIDSKYILLDNMKPIFGLAKAGAFALMALGVVGYLFESWRQRTSTILRGIDPEKLKDLS